MLGFVRSDVAIGKISVSQGNGVDPKREQSKGKPHAAWGRGSQRGRQIATLNSLPIKRLCCGPVDAILALNEDRSAAMFPKRGFLRVENATGVAFGQHFAPLWARPSDFWTGPL
jgi:hypothetical protein